MYLVGLYINTYNDTRLGVGYVAIYRFVFYFYALLVAADDLSFTRKTFAWTTTRLVNSLVVCNCVGCTLCLRISITSTLTYSVIWQPCLLACPNGLRSVDQCVDRVTHMGMMSMMYAGIDLLLLIPVWLFSLFDLPLFPVFSLWHALIISCPCPGVTFFFLFFSLRLPPLLIHAGPRADTKWKELEMAYQPTWLDCFCSGNSPTVTLIKHSLKSSYWRVERNNHVDSCL